MKKLFTLFLALVMIVSMAACGKTDAPDNSGDNAGKATYRVGVCQLAQHPALDAATQGFVDALKEELGDDVNIEVQNASGESNNCSTIINGFLSSDVDLIMANATPALTAAASATSEVPILGTAVTAYGVALDLDDFDGTVGGQHLRYLRPCRSGEAGRHGDRVVPRRQEGGAAVLLRRAQLTLPDR